MPIDAPDTLLGPGVKDVMSTNGISPAKSTGKVPPLCLGLLMVGHSTLRPLAALW